MKANRNNRTPTASTVGKPSKGAKKNRVGRPNAYTPTGIYRKFKEYVKWRKNTPIVENVVTGKGVLQVPREAPLTLTGFLIYAGISRDTFLRYERREEYRENIARVRLSIDADQLEGAMAGAYGWEIVTRVLCLPDRRDITTAGQPLQKRAVLTVSIDEEARKIIEEKKREKTR